MRRTRHVSISGFNPAVELPYGLNIAHLALATERVLEQLDALSEAAGSTGLPPLVTWAGKSALASLVSSAMTFALVESAPELLVGNANPTGFPDVLLRSEHHRHDAAKMAAQGLELKTTTRGLTCDVHRAAAGWYLVISLDTDSDVPVISDLYCARLTPMRDFAARVRPDGTVQVRVNAKGAARLRAGHVYSAAPALAVAA